MSIEQIQAAYNQEKWREVINLSTKLIESNNKDFRVFGFKGVAERKLGEFNESISSFDKAIEFAPSNADMYSEKGVSCFHAKRLVEGLEALNKAVELEPENPYRYSSRAYLRDAAKDIDGAIEDYEKAVQLDPEDGVALNNLGMLQEKKGYIEKSKKTFTKADEAAGVDYEKLDIDKEIASSGGKSVSEEAAKKEVEAVEKEIKNASASENSSDQKKSIWSVIKEVFTKKETFKEFLDFILRRKKD